MGAPRPDQTPQPNWDGPGGRGPWPAPGAPPAPRAAGVWLGTWTGPRSETRPTGVRFWVCPSCSPPCLLAPLPLALRFRCCATLYFFLHAGGRLWYEEGGPRPDLGRKTTNPKHKQKKRRKLRPEQIRRRPISQRKRSGRRSLTRIPEKKTSKLTFEDKKKPPSKVSQKSGKLPCPSGRRASSTKRSGKQSRTMWAWKAPTSPEEAVETGAYLVREGYRSHKLKPYRKAAQAERQLEKANVNVLYQKSLQENPQFASNPLSRWQQKQAIKSSMPPPNTPVRLPEIPPRLHPKPEKPQGR